MQKRDKDATWQTLHDELKALLTKEVYLMRELLANMHQEELSLLFHEEGFLKQMLDERSYIVKQLGEVRQERLKKTEEIETMATTCTLDAILPPQEDISAAILSLRDQLMALTEQMNRQQSATQRLIDHPNALPPRVQGRVPPKRKISITTK